MRVKDPGPLLFALSLAALGILSVVSGDFAFNWQPVPPWIPGRALLARASGLVLIASSLGVLLASSARVAARALVVYLSLWLLLLRGAVVVAHPWIEQSWLGFGENTMMLAGGWLLLASVTAARHDAKYRYAMSDGGTRFARFLYGLALVPVGLSHIVYIRATTALVPAWLPFRMGLAYFTGAAHIMAGLALIFVVLPRLAASLEAVMLGSFTILIWVPGAIGTPGSRLQWTALFVSSAITGAAWIVVRSIDGGSAIRRDQPQTI